MPPRNAKQPKGNAAKKEQIAEKVKEIQQRQKNWMRQRDQHLKHASTEQDTEPKFKKADTNPRTTQQSSGGADILKVHHDSPQDLPSQVSNKLNVKVKHGFGAWLQSRKHTTDNDHEQFNGIEHQEEGPRGTGLHILQAENSHCSTSSGISSLQSSNRAHLLSPAEFDSLADSIASRVKKDLGINTAAGSTNSRHCDTLKTNKEDFQRRGTFVQDSVQGMERNLSDGGCGGGDGDGDVDVSSHLCPFCSVLMASPEHVPTLMVPCGHTVCKHCSTSHSSCRLCGTRVASLTTNIMLQQIIQEFHRKNHERGTTAQHTWDSQRGLPSVPPKTTAKHCDVNYSTQLQRLMDRQDALEEEASSCKKEKARITSKVQRAEKQLTAIEREEEGLLEQLKQLQERLDGLRQHKEEYVGEYRLLQEEQKKASDQLALVEQTLKSLGEEMDKVQFLAEGQDQRKTHYR